MLASLLVHLRLPTAWHVRWTGGASPRGLGPPKPQICHAMVDWPYLHLFRSGVYQLLRVDLF
jgi:hypothetical protein